MKQLFVEEKLLLMKFVCVFAWADFQVHPAEKRFIEKLMDELDLNSQSRNCVYGWLQHPPKPEEVDPYQIPLELQETVLALAGALVTSDGVLDPKELEIIELLHSLCLDLDEDSTSKDSHDTNGDA